MNHPDFRVNARIFATLSSDLQSGVLMLTPEQQQELIADYPTTFSPAAGAWGAKGSTVVKLSGANKGAVRQGLHAAWSNRNAVTKKSKRSRSNRS